MKKNYKNILILIISISFQAFSDDALKEIFTNIYENHSWNGEESVSGSGSDLKATVVIRNKIPRLFEELHIKTVIDVPCGDFWWFKEIDMTQLAWYLGIDIVDELIQNNNALYANNKITFKQGDLSTEILPKADLVLCRDLFLHLSNATNLAILQNLKLSQAKYLLISTYPSIINNTDKKASRSCRPINLELPPFNFPKPIILIDENDNRGKHLGLWKLENLNNDI